VPSLLNLGTFGRLAQLFQRKKPRDAFLENLDEQWGNAWGTQPDASPPSRDPWLDQIASQYPFGAFDEPAAPAPAPELAMPQPAQPEPADDLAARIRASLGLGDTDEDNSLLAQVESTLRRQPYVQPPALPPAALSPTGAPPASRPPISLAPPDIATIGANDSDLTTTFGIDDPSCPVAQQSSPRQVAGGPRAENVYKCQLKTLSFTDPDYGRVQFSDDQQARLKVVFADGVCNWSVPGVGQAPANPWTTFAAGPGGRPLGPPPVSVPLP